MSSDDFDVSGLFPDQTPTPRARTRASVDMTAWLREAHLGVGILSGTGVLLGLRFSPDPLTPLAWLAAAASITTSGVVMGVWARFGPSWSVLTGVALVALATGAGLAGRVAPVVIAVAALTTVITRQVRRSKRAGDL